MDTRRPRPSLDAFVKPRFAPPQSARLEAVQAPIIPVLARWIAENPGTISLGQGVVSHGPPPQAFRRVAEFGGTLADHKYHRAHGLPPLLEAFGAKLAAENGIRVAEGGLFVTAGSNMGFMNAVLAMADPGDEFVLLSPCYFNHEMAVTMASCRPVLVPTDDRHMPEVGRIRDAITAKTRAVVTVSPNNPTGAVYPRETLEEINRMCAELGIFHIHDEAYEYFVFDGAESFSPGGIAGAEEHTISLYSLSKAYGFASWRIGFMVAPPVLRPAVQKIQDTILICAPAISQQAALGCLEAGKPWCDARIGELGRVREIVREGLARLGEDVEAPDSKGAFYYFLRLRGGWNSEELAKELILRHKVAVVPGTAFGVSSGTTLRVAYGALTADTAAEGVSRLVEGLSDLIH